MDINYAQAFSSATTWSLAGSVHQRGADVLVGVVDAGSPATVFLPGGITLAANGDLVATFGTAQAGTFMVARADYAVNFTTTTPGEAVTIAGSTHLLGTDTLLIQGWDSASPRNQAPPASITIDASTFTIVATFGTPTSGRLMVARAHYAQAFTLASPGTVTAAGATHGLGSAALLVGFLDTGTPRFVLEAGQVTIATGSFDVVASFSSTQSGRLLLHGGLFILEEVLWPLMTLRPWTAPAPLWRAETLTDDQLSPVLVEVDTARPWQVWTNVPLAWALYDDTVLGMAVAPGETEDLFRPLVWPPSIPPPVNSQDDVFGALPLPITDEDPIRQTRWRLPVSALQSTGAGLAPAPPAVLGLAMDEPFPVLVWPLPLLPWAGMPSDETSLPLLLVDEGERLALAVWSSLGWVPPLLGTQADDSSFPGTLGESDAWPPGSAWAVQTLGRLAGIDDVEVVSQFLEDVALLTLRQWGRTVSRLQGTQLSDTPGPPAAFFLPEDFGPAGRLWVMETPPLRSSDAESAVQVIVVAVDEEAAPRLKGWSVQHGLWVPWDQETASLPGFIRLDEADDRLRSVVWLPPTQGLILPDTPEYVSLLAPMDEDALALRVPWPLPGLLPLRGAEDEWLPLGLLEEGTAPGFLSLPQVREIYQRLLLDQQIERIPPGLLEEGTALFLTLAPLAKTAYHRLAVVFNTMPEEWRKFVLAPYLDYYARRRGEP